MTIYDAVLKATRLALAEDSGDAESLDALRFVRSLPREMRAEARASVEYVYQNGRAPRSVRQLRTAGAA